MEQVGGDSGVFGLGGKASNRLPLKLLIKVWVLKGLRVRFKAFKWFCLVSSVKFNPALPLLLVFQKSRRRKRVIGYERRGSLSTLSFLRVIKHAELQYNT